MCRIPYTSTRTGFRKAERVGAVLARGLPFGMSGKTTARRGTLRTAPAVSVRCARSLADPWSPAGGSAGEKGPSFHGLVCCGAGAWSNSIQGGSRKQAHHVCLTRRPLTHNLCFREAFHRAPQPSEELDGKIHAQPGQETVETRVPQRPKLRSMKNNSQGNVAA